MLLIGLLQLKLIKGCQTTQQIWQKLSSIYSSKGAVKKTVLLTKLITYGIAEHENLHDYINEFIEIVGKITEIGINISEKLLSVMLLTSLPDSYENFVCHEI